MAKSLFTKRLLRFLPQRLELPARLPFDGVAPFPRQSMRYASTIDVPALLTAATGELATSDPEAFKGFLLCFCGGLRRNECDKLRWSSIDFDAGLIRIEAQVDFSAKCETSLADIPIDPEVCALLRGLRAREPRASYVMKGDPRKINKSFRAYGWQFGMPKGRIICCLAFPSTCRRRHHRTALHFTKGTCHTRLRGIAYPF
jgi:integrase